MKKTLLLLTISMITNILSAQQVDNKKINFTYTQFPSIPVKGVGNYNGMVVMNYQDKVAKIQAAHSQDQAAAETEYQTALANYQTEQKRADDEYKEAMNQYKMELQKAEDEYQAAIRGGQQNPNGNGVTKGGSTPNPTNTGNGVTKGGTTTPNNNGTAVSDTSKVKDKPIKRFVPEPIKREVPMPEKRRVYPPHYPKIFDEKNLGDTYLKIEGMTQNSNNALVLITTLRGFEIGEKQVKEEQNSRKDDNGNVITTMSYQGSMQYKHPIHIQVVSPIGQTLWEEVVGDKFESKKTAKFSTRIEAEQNLHSDNFINPLEDAVVQKSMKYIQAQLNDKFGYTKQKRNTMLRTYSLKKVVYPEYQEAYNAAVEAYPKIEDLSKKADVLAGLNKAITAWENALTQSNPNDKKARINKKVTISTHYMLAEAYLWIENFEKAEYHLAKMDDLDAGGPEKKWAKELKILLNDQKFRIGAYNKL